MSESIDTVIVEGDREAQLAAAFMVRQSKLFSVEPLPHEMFEFIFRAGEGIKERLSEFVNLAREVDSDEVVATLLDGTTIRSGVYDVDKALYLCGEYVQVVDVVGNEVAYWDYKEWEEDPILVMGAMVNALAGSRVSSVNNNKKNGMEE